MKLKLLTFAAVVLTCAAQSVLMPAPEARLQLFDNSGRPLVGGLVYTYAAGTTTPLATYTDGGGLSPNTNPVVLDSAGRAGIWLQPQKYKLVVQDRNGVTIWTADQVPGGGNYLSLSGGVIDGNLQVTGNTTLNNLTVQGTCVGCGGPGGGGSDLSINTLTATGAIQSTATGTNIAFQTRDLTQQTLTTPLQINGQGDISTSGNINATGYITSHTWFGLPATNTAPTSTPGGGFSALSYKGGSTFWYYDTTAAQWKTADIAGGGGGSGNPVFDTVTSNGIFKAKVNSPNIAFQVSTVDGSGNETGPTPLQIDGGGNVSAAGNANITGFVTTHTWLGMPVTASTPGTSPGAGFSAFVYKGGTAGTEFWYYNTVSHTWASFDVAAVGGGVTSVDGFSGAVTIAGTADQVAVANASNTVTLSLPQSIAATSTPAFTGLFLSDTSLNTLNIPNGFISTQGLAALSTNSDSIQTAGGFKASLGITLDQGLYMKTYAANTSLNAPAAGYGGLAHKAGSQYWYYDGATWLTADLSTVGGGVTSLAGTANQVNVSNATGSVILSLPQNIAGSSSPQFATETLTGSATNTLSVPNGFITAKGLIATATNFDSIQTAGGFKGLQLSLFAAPNPGVSQTGSGVLYFDNSANRFKVSQNGGAYQDLLGAAAGVSSVNSLTGAITLLGTANQVSVSPAGQNITLALPQGIATTSNVTFGSVIANGGAFNSAVNGGTIGFQVQNTGGATPFQVNGNGVVSIGSTASAPATLNMNASSTQLTGMNVTGGNLNVVQATVNGSSQGGQIWAAGGYYVGSSPNFFIDALANITAHNLNVTGTCTGCGSGSTVNGASGAISLVGTANQVGVTTSGNTITLFGPQSLAPSSAVTFSSVTTGAGGVVQSGATGGSVAFQTTGFTFQVFGDGRIASASTANTNGYQVGGVTVVDGARNATFQTATTSSTLAVGGGANITGGVSSAGFNPLIGGTQYFGQSQNVTAVCNVNGTNYPVFFFGNLGTLIFKGGSLVGAQ